MNIYIHVHKSKDLYLSDCLGLNFTLALVMYSNVTLLDFVSLGHLALLSYLQIWGFISFRNSMSQSLI